MRTNREKAIIRAIAKYMNPWSFAPDSSSNFLARLLGRQQRERQQALAHAEEIYKIVEKYERHPRSRTS